MKWEICVHPHTKRDLEWLKKENPAALAEIKASMRELEAMDDPRRHPHVKKIERDCPGWYRLACYQTNVRVLFRLLQRDHKGVREIHPGDAILDSDLNAVQITKAGERRNFYRGTDRRQERVRQSDR
jgi:hypothetical protein